MPEFTLVDNPATLESTLRELDLIAVDTEFMREKTFFSQLCLVQLATGDRIYCVDPLEADLSSFWASALTVPWVLHSGRQDIEVVYQVAGRMPDAVFDTQVAAGLLALAFLCLCPIAAPAAELSCESGDNSEGGCCCFLKAHTYEFDPVHSTLEGARVWY